MDTDTVEVVTAEGADADGDVDEDVDEDVAEDVELLLTSGASVYRGKYQ